MGEEGWDARGRVAWARFRRGHLAAFEGVAESVGGGVLQLVPHHDSRGAAKIFCRDRGGRTAVEKRNVSGGMPRRFSGDGAVLQHHPVSDE